MKTLRTYGNLAEAGFAKSLLEAAGITAELADENAYAAGYGRVVGDLRLQVDEQDFEKATHVPRRRLGRNNDSTPARRRHRMRKMHHQANSGLPISQQEFSLRAVLHWSRCSFAVAQWRERQKDGSSEEQVMKYDTNNDGKTDTVYTYRGRNLSRVTFDRNNDGKPDQWEEYNSNGIIVSSSEDNNFDGVPDNWITTITANQPPGKADRDFNGAPDVYATYRNSLIERTEVRPNGAKVPVRVQKYVNGILREEQVDADQDGRPDYRIEYDPFGTPSEHLPIETAK
jgi:hypothetical protein